jgi:hypothetical protein
MYLESIQKAEKYNLQSCKILASINLAAEEKRISEEESKKYIAEAEKSSTRTSDPGIKLLIERLRKPKDK